MHVYFLEAWHHDFMTKSSAARGCWYWQTCIVHSLAEGFARALFRLFRLSIWSASKVDTALQTPKARINALRTQRMDILAHFIANRRTGSAGCPRRTISPARGNDPTSSTLAGVASGEPAGGSAHRQSLVVAGVLPVNEPLAAPGYTRAAAALS